MKRPIRMFFAIVSQRKVAEKLAEDEDSILDRARTTYNYYPGRLSKFGAR